MATQTGRKKADRVRVNVEFPEKIYAQLERLARTTGKSKAQVIRDALALEAWLQETREEGGHILVERDGKVREVVVR